MKYLVVILVFMMAACHGGELSDADEAAVREAAERDARRAAEASGERECEEAVLAIRARETGLRMNGHDEAADIYEATAAECLRRDSVISSAR